MSFTFAPRGTFHLDEIVAWSPLVAANPWIRVDGSMAYVHRPPDVLQVLPTNPTLLNACTSTSEVQAAADLARRDMAIFTAT